MLLNTFNTFVVQFIYNMICFYFRYFFVTMNIVRATPIAVHSYNCSCLFLSGKIGRRHLLSPRSSATVYGVSSFFDENRTEQKYSARTHVFCAWRWKFLGKPRNFPGPNGVLNCLDRVQALIETPKLGSFPIFLSENHPAEAGDSLPRSEMTLNAFQDFSLLFKWW